jgi:hypothetical protein
MSGSYGTLGKTGQIIYGVLASFVILAVFTAINLGFKETKTVTKTKTKTVNVVAKDYASFTKAYGEGQALTAEQKKSLGVPENTPCATWQLDGGYALLCKA